MPALKFKQVAKVGLKRVVDATLSVAPSGDHQTSRDYYLAMSQLYERYADLTPSAPDHDLTPAELRVASQNGEDGVLAEILRRVGIRDGPRFVEFGAESGAEGNCVFLADILGWDGLFIEGDDWLYQRLHEKYALRDGVVTLNRFVTTQDIEDTFRTGDVPTEFDVLSIDIDGQDLWIWRALRDYRPRVVIIEYNSGLPASSCIAEPEGHSGFGAAHTAFFGASIGAIRALGAAKGYRLVHTDLTGSNAFLVRDDLSGLWPAAEEVQLRGLNYRLRARGHPPDPLGREFVEISDRTLGT